MFNITFQLLHGFHANGVVKKTRSQVSHFALHKRWNGHRSINSRHSTTTAATATTTTACNSSRVCNVLANYQLYLLVWIIYVLTLSQRSPVSVKHSKRQYLMWISGRKSFRIFQEDGSPGVVMCAFKCGYIHSGEYWLQWPFPGLTT